MANITTTSEQSNVQNGPRVIDYNELLYETYRQLENVQWRSFMTCLNQMDIKEEQVSLLKTIIKKKKETVKLFTKLLALSADKDGPCIVCEQTQKDLANQQEKVQVVTAHQPNANENAFQRYYIEFQQELAKYFYPVVSPSVYFDTGHPSHAFEINKTNLALPRQDMVLERGHEDGIAIDLGTHMPSQFVPEHTAENINDNMTRDALKFA